MLEKAFLIALLVVKLEATAKETNDLEITTEEEVEGDSFDDEDHEVQEVISKNRHSSYGALMSSFLELHEDDKNLACSACHIVVRKIVENAKVSLRKSSSREALSDLSSGCKFDGMAKIGDEYKNFQKMMSSGGAKFSGAVTMNKEIDEHFEKSCVSVVDKYEQYIWDMFVSKERKMTGWSGYKLSREICREKEKICPDKTKRRWPAKSEL